MAEKQTLTLAEKFINAWANIENPDLDGFNPHFKNKYATLKATFKVIREACVPFGLVYQQRLQEMADGSYRLVSSIQDGSETIGLSTFPVENVPNSQAFGSEMTYKKRQMAQCDWGIVGEEDEDGEAITATQSQSKPQQQPRGTQRPQQRQTPATAQQKAAAARKETIAYILKLKMQAIENGVLEEGINSWFESKFGSISLNRLSNDQLKEVTDYLETIVRNSSDRHLLNANGEQSAKQNASNNEADGGAK